MNSFRTGTLIGALLMAMVSLNVHARTPYLGEIMMSGMDYCPRGSVEADGRLQPALSGNSTLFSLLGTAFGGDGVDTFALPDLRGRIPMGVGGEGETISRQLGDIAGGESINVFVDSDSTTELKKQGFVYFDRETGNEISINADEFNEDLHWRDFNQQVETIYETYSTVSPAQIIHYCIFTEGIYPDASRQSSATTAVPVEDVSEIMLVGFNYCPDGWLEADGALLQTWQEERLFDKLGTMFGGDGVDTFALPDFRGRIPVGAGEGPGLYPRQHGEKFGREDLYPISEWQNTTKILLAGPEDDFRKMDEYLGIMPPVLVLKFCIAR